MGMVFQSFNLFGHLTVIENLMLSPVDLLGKSKQEAYDEGMRLLRTVALAVLKGMTESVGSSRNEDAELPNTLRLVIRSG